jgi:hypothetical protein
LIDALAKPLKLPLEEVQKLKEKITELKETKVKDVVL